MMQNDVLVQACLKLFIIFHLFLDVLPKWRSWAYTLLPGMSVYFICFFKIFISNANL